MRIGKDKVLERLRGLRSARTPVIFYVSLRQPRMTASGHGLLGEISERLLTVKGRTGALTVMFDEIVGCEITGHYALSEQQLADLDPYFRQCGRVRCLSFQTEHGEAALIFGVSNSKNSRAKQSRADRLKRLQEGRCPIHGSWLSQTNCMVDANHHEISEGDEEEHPEPWFFPMACPRKGCDIEVRALEDVVKGPFELSPDFAYLLDES
jgi:hypothetical protein